MARVYYLNCPKCDFRYYVGEPLIAIPKFPSHCPKCHHVFQLEESPTWKLPASASGTMATDLRGKPS